MERLKQSDMVCIVADPHVKWMGQEVALPFGGQLLYKLGVHLVSGASLKNYPGAGSRRYLLLQLFPSPLHESVAHIPKIQIGERLIEIHPKNFDVKSLHSQPTSLPSSSI